MKQHFTALADYNRWANRRLYADAANLTADQLCEDAGLYFGSLLATFGHLLSTDRAWRHILADGRLEDMRIPPAPTAFAALRAEREAEDARLAAWIESREPAWFAAPFAFTSGLGQWRGLTCSGTRADFLTHLFNHQTHHRGQVHAGLTRLGVAEPAALDLLVKGFLEPH
jgi:uncharacterized damage-inducible protein DinB